MAPSRLDLSYGPKRRPLHPAAPERGRMLPREPWGMWGIQVVPRVLCPFFLENGWRKSAETKPAGQMLPTILCLNWRSKSHFPGNRGKGTERWHESLQTCCFAGLVIQAPGMFRLKEVGRWLPAGSPGKQRHRLAQCLGAESLKRRCSREELPLEGARREFRASEARF